MTDPTTAPSAPCCRRCGSPARRERMPAYMRPLRIVFGAALRFLHCYGCDARFLARG